MASQYLRAFFDEAAIINKRAGVNQSSDGNIGSAQGKSASASQLLSTLAPVVLIAFIWLIVFVFVRSKAAWKYAPRTQSKILREGNYTPALPNSKFGWLPSLWKIPDTYVLSHQSLDAYLFLRFLKIAVVICLVGCCITWPVLFPVNATGGAGKQQLDILSMANVSSPWRFFAHAGCAWLFFGFVMIMITRESIFYINLRQAYLMSPQYAHKLSARVVLFTAVPDDYLNEAKLREMLGPSVSRVWFPTNTKDLDDIVEERNKVAMKLEGAETKLVKKANAARLKSMAKGADHHEESNVGLDNGTTGSVAARWISPKDRPTHRLKPLIGKKVDTISWSREELTRLEPKVQEIQSRHRNGSAPFLSAVFVEFDSLREAQAAYQSLTHHSMLTMSPRYTGVHPADIIWKNLRIKGWERFVRVAVTLSIVCATIIFWSIPVAAIGAISNINYLTSISAFSWLKFIDKMPQVLVGVITGLLPVVLLSLLMSLLPPFLRWMARLGGAPTYSDAEYTCQNYYFAFQIIQVFLVATLGAAASSTVKGIINDPSSAPSVLSSSIPTASNFYLSYFVLQGLAVVSGLLVGIAGLFVTPLLVKLLGSTPRKIFLKWNKLAGVSWGVVYPVMTNLLVIAICYACIAPLVLIFAAIGMFFFYFAYRYNFLYVYDVGIDTHGAVYARALQQLFFGLYIAEICLFGLMATRLNTTAAIGPFILVVLLLIFTALYHVSLNAALSPLIKYLPKSLDAEERRSLLEGQEDSYDQGNDVESPATQVDHKGQSLEKGDSTRGGAMSEKPPHKKPSMIQKFLKPHIYNDYRTMRRLVPNYVPPTTNPEEADTGLVSDAYLPPSVWNECPQLVIPRDDGGVSAQEVRDSSKVCSITDQGAHFNEKNKIIVDDDFMSAVYFDDKLMRMKSEH